MTVQTKIYVYCDGDDCPCPDEPLHAGDNEANVYQLAWEQIVHSDWVSTDQGDLCPECQGGEQQMPQISEEEYKRLQQARENLRNLVEHIMRAATTRAQRVEWSAVTQRCGLPVDEWNRIEAHAARLDAEWREDDEKD